MPRPVYSFRNFIGQRKVVELLLRQLRGAIARGEPFPTACFAGPSGVGKTLLAKTLAGEGPSPGSASGFGIQAAESETGQVQYWASQPRTAKQARKQTEWRAGGE